MHRTLIWYIAKSYYSQISNHEDYCFFLQLENIWFICWSKSYKWNIMEWYDVWQYKIDLEEGFVPRHQKHYFQSPFSDSILIRNHVFKVLHCDYLNMKVLKLQNIEILP